MQGFILSLNSTKSYLSNKETNIALTIENKSGKDCFIPRDVIMLDGFKNNKFKIVSCDGKEITYRGRYVKYYPELTLLKDNHSLSNELNLCEVYALSTDKDYLISYNTQLKCCIDQEGTNCSPSGLVSAETHINLFDCNLM